MKTYTYAQDSAWIKPKASGEVREYRIKSLKREKGRFGDQFVLDVVGPETGEMGCISFFCDSPSGKMIAREGMDTALGKTIGVLARKTSTGTLAWTLGM